MAFFLSVLGVVLIVEGIPYFGFPRAVKKLAKQLPELPDAYMRGLGLILMVIGLLITYVGVRMVN